jgi:hypothetical protein
MAPHLSCEINGVQCKALCDIGTQVSVLSSKIYDKVQDHNLDLAPTSTKLIMGDGSTIRPLGIACNNNVIISIKCISTDFVVIDAYHSNHDHIILVLMVKFRQPSHEFTFSIGMTFVSYPLVLTPVV